MYKKIKFNFVQLVQKSKKIYLYNLTIKFKEKLF